MNWNALVCPRTNTVRLSSRGKHVATVTGGEREADIYVDAYMDAVNLTRSRPFTSWAINWAFVAPVAANETSPATATA